MNVNSGTTEDQQSMGVHKIKKGLDIPLAGEPEQKIHNAKQPRRVALLAEDYIGLRPTMFVAVGDAVRRGQRLFEDKKNPGVVATSPAAGTVVAINRGERRAFQSVVIELSDRERTGQVTDDDSTPFEMYSGGDPAALPADEVKGLLLESGLWTAIRRRPYSRVARPSEAPHSIFVTACDTNPHAPSVAVVMEGREADFDAGVAALSKLTEGNVYICKAPEVKGAAGMNGRVQVEEFSGPHPAGNPGLHIHLLDPVHREKVVWYVGYQDVMAMGRLFRTGKLDVERVVSLAGPVVKNPRLLRTRLGASTMDLVDGELDGVDNRIVSGSALAGRTAMGEIFGYLGRYHNQVSALHEGHEREFLGWMTPGANKFSVVNIFLAKLLRRKHFNLTTNANGSPRAMVPIGTYEKVNPMDIQPTYLLRALIVGDTERAEQLGCLELDEDDVALFTFVCPGKYDYGPILRRNLEDIEKEG